MVKETISYDLLAIGICGTELWSLLNDISEKKITTKKIRYRLMENRNEKTKDISTPFAVGLCCGQSCSSSSTNCRIIFGRKNEKTGWSMMINDRNKTCENGKFLYVLSKVIGHLISKQ